MLHITVITRDSENKPVLFLHGFLGAGSDWLQCIAQLSDQFTCIAVDLPGHGQSLKCDDAAYSFDGCAQLIIDLLDQQGLQETHIVGYSMGGRIALYLAHRFPDRFNKVVLESASPGLQTEEERAIRWTHDDRLAQELEQGDFAIFLQRWYDQPLFETLVADPGRFERIIEKRLQNEPHELAKALRGFSTGVQPSLWPVLPKIDKPLLLVVGERDAKFRAIAQRMVELNNHMQITIVPDSGHNVHEEQPDTFADRLLAFLVNS